MSEVLSFTNDEIRRRRLAELVAMTPGGLPAIAKKAEVNAKNLDHVVQRRKQSTVRADQSQPLVAMGDRVARQIEAAYELGAGWFDWPFNMVDFKAWLALDAEQQAYVQGQMGLAIRQVHEKQAALSAVNESADKRSIPGLRKRA